MLGVGSGETEEVWGGIGICKRSGAEKQGFGVPRGDQEVSRREIRPRIGRVTQKRRG